jgi:hypothetical protein
VNDEIRRRWCENPFFVLGLPRDAQRADIERTAQRLLAEHALGRAAALCYLTPFGEAARTPELIRAAVAELRDPKKRVMHELFAAMPTEPLEASAAEAPWPEALRLLR